MTATETRSCMADVGEALKVTSAGVHITIVGRPAKLSQFGDVVAWVGLVGMWKERARLLDSVEGVGAGGREGGGPVEELREPGPKGPKRPKAMKITTELIMA